MEDGAPSHRRDDGLRAGRLQILRCTKFPRLPDIDLYLSNERIHVLEFLFRPEISNKTDFEVFAVDVLIEIQQMNFENAFRLATAHRRPKPEINHAM